jgi:Tol biopolymer transport system component
MDASTDNHMMLRTSLACFLSLALGSLPAWPQADSTTTLPLKPTRTLEFTTDEGTWISVDVAPDGQTIVFDMLGDLYTLPITGGKATRITSGMAWDTQPRFSPDGKQILFVSDRTGSATVWLANRDGSGVKKVIDEENVIFRNPEWLPGGKSFVAVRHLEGGIRDYELNVYRFDSKGGGIKLNTQDAGGLAYVAAPAPTPDPRKLYVSMGSDLLLGPKTPWQIYEYDVVDKKFNAITFSTRKSFNPRVSPDGNTLAYFAVMDGKTALVLRNLGTGDDRILTRDVQKVVYWGTLEDWGFAPGISFTPDSRSLVFTHLGKVWKLDVASGARTPIPFTVDVRQPLGPLAKFEYTQADSTIVASRIRFPKLSPDGKRVVFAALQRVWIADLTSCRDGESGRKVCTPRRLTRGTVLEDRPIWSPDGQWIAYATWEERVGGDIFRVRADGSGAPENLTRAPALYQQLNYFPDGSRIIATMGKAMYQGFRLHNSSETGGISLVTVPANGGRPEKLGEWLSGYTSAGQMGWPHFARSPLRRDSIRIHFFSRDGLESMRPDGLDRRKHFTVAEYTPDTYAAYGPREPEDFIISPAGDRAIVTGARSVYLLPLPTDGPPPSMIRVHPAGSGMLPSKELSSLGADFSGWTDDAKLTFWSLGRSLFVYDVAAGEAPAHRAARYDMEIRVPRDRPSGTIALEGARIITMKGDEVIQNGTIIVTDNRITAVGPSSKVRVPAGATRMSMKGKTIIPGYVDLHAHVHPEELVQQSQPYELLAMLAYGVTTIRDPQSGTFEAFDQRDLVATGDILGPRYTASGPAIRESHRVHSREDGREVMRRWAEFYDSQTIKEYFTGDRQRRQWLIMAAHDYKITPTNEGGWSSIRDLSYMFDGYAGTEHLIPAYPLYKDVLQLIAASGITYTPTVMTHDEPISGSYFYRKYRAHSDPRLVRYVPEFALDWRTYSTKAWMPEEDYEFSHYGETFAKITAAGGKIGLGNHGDLQGLGAHFELWSIGSGGLTPLQVLRIGTLNGADAIGLARELGSLEPGKLADLQILDKNPLDNIENTTSVRWVMKNGRLYESHTLDEIYPRKRKLPEMWWWKEIDSREGQLPRK